MLGRSREAWPSSAIGMTLIGTGIVLAALAGSQSLDAAERDQLLAAAREPVEETLGKPPVLVTRELNSEGQWAFLFADLQQQDGTSYDYSGTVKAEAARRGVVSHAYAALLRRDENGWRVVECVIGPTDVAWEGWGRKYNLPASLFAFDGG